MCTVKLPDSVVGEQLNCRVCENWDCMSLIGLHESVKLVSYWEGRVSNLNTMESKIE
jgi:hypothetical protein